jgi:hypothetical protein
METIDFAGYEEWLDSLDAQRYEDDVAEAKRLADSNPATPDSLAALAWYNRQPKAEPKCPACGMSNADFHYDGKHAICHRYETFIADAAYA